MKGTRTIGQRQDRDDRGRLDHGVVGDDGTAISTGRTTRPLADDQTESEAAGKEDPWAPG
jgi:hypothetical protein